MTLEVNQHVAKLRRFQPFQTDSAELVYEHTNPNDPHFEAVALEFLTDLIERPEVRLIVLTGDAGHGKTSLCARLLQRLGRDPVEAHQTIRDLDTSAEPIAKTVGGRDIRLLTDLSEVGREEAAPLLARLVEPVDDSIAIVCANEGHLRSSVSADVTGRSQVIIDTLVNGIQFGLVAGPDPGVQVINLNFQSTAPDGKDGLVGWATREWSADGRRWRSCQRCDARESCPILANHRSLSDGDHGVRRREGIRNLFAAAERMGTVITTRQALAIVAYAVTGGLVCEDVHKRYTKDRSSVEWQYRHLYHQALFADRLTVSKRRQVPAFAALRRLDPGSVSLRAVDDTLDPDDTTSQFLPPRVDGGRGPRSRREAQRESEMMRALVAYLRRLDYFESGDAHLRRMGLISGSEFVAIATGATASVEVRDRLLRGLEAAQGVRRPGEPPDFLVLDPAFFSHRNRAAVIAERIHGRKVDVLSQFAYWRDAGPGVLSLPIAVDWSSRAVYLQVSGSRKTITIALDLMRFELLRRWAAGLTTRGQYEAETRSLTRALAELVPTSSSTDDIDVLVNGERRSLTIDVGDRIRSGGA
ncbi:ATP-binding protein [Kribbella endophytica]